MASAHSPHIPQRRAGAHTEASRNGSSSSSRRISGIVHPTISSDDVSIPICIVALHPFLASPDATPLSGIGCMQHCANHMVMPCAHTSLYQKPHNRAINQMLPEIARVAVLRLTLAEPVKANVSRSTSLIAGFWVIAVYKAHSVQVACTL